MPTIGLWTSVCSFSCHWFHGACLHLLPSVYCIFQSRLKAIQHVRQSIYNLFDCAGPRLFHLAYGISFYAFWRRFHVLFPHISMTLKWWKKHKYRDNYEVNDGQTSGNFILPPIANWDTSLSVWLACMIHLLWVVQVTMSFYCLEFHIKMFWTVCG